MSGAGMSMNMNLQALFIVARIVVERACALFYKSIGNSIFIAVVYSNSRIFICGINFFWTCAFGWVELFIFHMSICFLSDKRNEWIKSSPYVNLIKEDGSFPRYNSAVRYGRVCLCLTCGIREAATPIVPVMRSSIPLPTFLRRLMTVCQAW